VDFAQARAQFPVLRHFAYLNAGTFGPLSEATVEAMEQRQLHDLELGRSGPDFFAEVAHLRDRVRERIAGLIGAETASVALTCSTTDGCNIVLAGLDLEPEDEIVTTTDEHFGLLGPLHASGARILVAAPEPERILAAVTPHTKLLALSQVLWTDGRVLPVAQLRERSGLPVLVDGAQAVGAIPVDTTGVDFLTVSGQKWLCGPDTVGALFVREPEELRVAQPSYFAQKSFEPSGVFEPRPGAARFDSQWIAPSSLSGLLAALDGRPEWAFERAAEITELCRAWLAERFEVVSLPGQGTLVSWRVRDDPKALVRKLFGEGVVVRDIPGRGIVRSSCGWWTSVGDIEQLLDALMTLTR
jgi:L-cysteine/cystine lyase